AQLALQRTGAIRLGPDEHVQRPLRGMERGAETVGLRGTAALLQLDGGVLPRPFGADDGRRLLARATGVAANHAQLLPWFHRPVAAELPARPDLHPGAAAAPRRPLRHGLPHVFGGGHRRGGQGPPGQHCAGKRQHRSSIARTAPLTALFAGIVRWSLGPLLGCAAVRSPDAPLPTDHGPPGLEHRLRIRALRMSCIKDLVQAVAFTAAGVWAIYNFWYRERYLPRTIDANVVVRTTLEKLGEKDGTVAVRLAMVAENHGAAPARILGLSRWAFGQRIGAAPGRD